MKKYMKRLIKVLLSFFSIFAGGLIYLGFRTQTLALFTWADWIGVSSFVQSWRSICSSVDLPEWVRFSLPDGLWTLSFILLLDSIWMDIRNKRFIFYASLLPGIAIILEFLQLIGFLNGTFDFMDLICYFGSILFFLLLKIYL